MENSFSVELEEDAIRYGHPQEFRVGVSELEDLWVENLFGEETTVSMLDPDMTNPAFQDLIASIQKNIALYRLYIAVSFSKASEEAMRRGLVRYEVNSILRDGLVALSETKTEADIEGVNETFCRDLRLLYRNRPKKAYSQLVRNAMDFIRFNCNKRMSTIDVAEGFGVDRAMLAKKFKRETGKTITEYILQTKMEEARRMQKRGIYSLEEISDALDFPSYAYFSRRYKQYFGIAPSKCDL